MISDDPFESVPAPTPTPTKVLAPEGKVLSTEVPTPETLKEWLKPVEDPELYMSLLELGLIYGVDLDSERHAVCRMTLTSPGCPAGDYLVKEVTKRLLEHEAVKSAEVRIVWEPKWDPKTMASEECKEALGIW